MLKHKQPRIFNTSNSHNQFKTQIRNLMRSWLVETNTPHEDIETYLTWVDASLNNLERAHGKNAPKRLAALLSLKF